MRAVASESDSSAGDSFSGVLKKPLSTVKLVSLLHDYRAEDEIDKRLLQGILLRDIDSI